MVQTWGVREAMSITDILQLRGQSAALDVQAFTIALVFALLCSIVVLLLYNAFYSNRNIGSGVNRFFLLGGPAITALFLGIQFSLPLSLGLLGALSIVRFRTPVKDPAEIGFILLLVAAAIGSATFNYLMVVVLLVLSFAVLLGQRLLQVRLAGESRSYLMVTFDGDGDSALQARVTSLVSRSCRNARLESLSSSDGKVSLHYQVNRPAGFDWGQFRDELEQLATPTKVSLFVN